MSWTEIDNQLKERSVEDLIKLLKGLHDLSPQNKAWLRAKLLPVVQDTKYLEDCHRKVANYVYKETKGMPLQMILATLMNHFTTNLSTCWNISRWNCAEALQNMNCMNCSDHA